MVSQQGRPFAIYEKRRFYISMKRRGYGLYQYGKGRVPVRLFPAQRLCRGDGRPGGAPCEHRGQEGGGPGYRYGPAPRLAGLPGAGRHPRRTHAGRVAV